MQDGTAATLQPLLVEARRDTVGWWNSWRRWVAICLVVGVMSTVLCGTMLLTPATTLAAAARTQSSHSCGQISRSDLTVTAGQLGASIWLNETLGLAGDSLVIRGSGWPGDTAITIDAYGYNGYHQLVLGKTALVRATTDSAGSFQTASFEAPTFATCTAPGAYYGEPGTVVYFRAHTRDNQISAEVRFLFQLSPWLTTSSQTEMGILPGSTIPITGEGWEAGEWVTVTTSVTSGLSQVELNNAGAAQPSSEPPIRVKAVGFGEFTTQVVVPSDLTPQTAVVVNARATGPIYGSIIATPLILTVLPTVVPTFTVNRAQGYPGSQATLSGTHWLLGGVLAEYCRGQTSGNPLTNNWPYEIPHLDCYIPVSEELGFAPVKGGSFRLTVTIPDNARPGPITIQVRADSDILPAIYVLAVPFTVLATWQMVHPRLALALQVGKVVVPLLLLVGGGTLAVMLWQQRRRSRMRQAR